VLKTLFVFVTEAIWNDSAVLSINRWLCPDAILRVGMALSLAVVTWMDAPRPPRKGNL
jgi:hypothetical protein